MGQRGLPPVATRGRAVAHNPQPRVNQEFTLGVYLCLRVCVGVRGRKGRAGGGRARKKNVRRFPARHQPWQALLNDPSAKTHTSVHAPYHQLTPVYISSYHKRSFRPMHHKGARTMYPDGVRDNMGRVHLPSACGHGHESLVAAMQRCPPQMPAASPTGFAFYLLPRALMGIRTDKRRGAGDGRTWRVAAGAWWSAGRDRVGVCVEAERGGGRRASQWQGRGLV